MQQSKRTAGGRAQIPRLDRRSRDWTRVSESAPKPNQSSIADKIRRPLPGQIPARNQREASCQLFLSLCRPPEEVRQNMMVDVNGEGHGASVLGILVSSRGGGRP